MATSTLADMDGRLAELDIEAIALRFDFLWKNMPYCVVCGDPQVQLIDKKAPAEWKCRRCKAPFFHEPKCDGAVEDTSHRGGDHGASK